MAAPCKRKWDATDPEGGKHCASTAGLGEFASTLHALRNGAYVDCHPACGWVLDHKRAGDSVDALALAALLGQLQVLEQLSVLGCTEALEQLVLPGFTDVAAVYADEARKLGGEARLCSLLTNARVDERLIVRVDAAW